MRRTAAIIAGAAAFAFMLLTVPWTLEACVAGCAPEETSLFPDDALLRVYLVEALVLATVLALILVPVLGIRDAAAPEESAVRAALGETTHASLGRALVIGLRDGATAVAFAYVITGTLHVGIEVSRGWEPFSVSADAWQVRLVEACAAVVALTVAHGVVALRRRGTPVDRLHADSRRRATGMPRRGALAVAVVGALAAGVVVGLAASHGTMPGYRVTNAAGIAVGIAWLASVALAFGVALPWARVLAARAVAGASRVVAGFSATRVGAVLDARSRTGSRAMGRAMVALGGIAFAWTAFVTSNPGIEQSDRFLGSFIVTGDHDQQETAARLDRIEGVATVIVAPAADSASTWKTIVAVEPERLRAVDPALAEALTRHPGAAVAGRITSITDLGVGTAVPTGIVPCATCTDAYVAATPDWERAADHTAYLIYASDTADLTALVSGMDGVSPIGGDDAGFGMSVPASTESGGFTDMLLSLLGGGIVLAIPMAALALGVIRAGAREAATMAALGADARSQRWAITLEVWAVGAVAVGVGTVAGAAVRIVMTMLERARVSLTGVITDTYIGAGLDSVNWTAALAGAVGFTTVFGAVATLGAWMVRLETPAQAMHEGLVGVAR